MDIFDASIVGYKNKIKRSKSQDYVDYKIIDNGVICAVADGHSTSYFKHSDIGSKFACQVAIQVLENIPKKLDLLLEKLDNGEIQKEINDKWNNMVNEHYKKTYPVVFKTEYIKYSTTLIAALISDSFRLYLKIGDGGVVEKVNEKFRKVLDVPQKQVVDSFGREEAYINMVYDLKINNKEEDNPNWIILFTDGYENSYFSDEDMYNSLQKTISKYNSNIFSKARLKNNYKNYLNKLSKDVTQDDISIIFVGLK